MKRVLITGGASGLGKEIVSFFWNKGYIVYFTYNSSEKEAFIIEEENNKIRENSTFKIKCDLSNEKDIINLEKYFVSNNIEIDLLINNAAYENNIAFKDKDFSNFRKTLEVNVIGTFLLSKIIGSRMFNRKSGKIIFISSNNALDKYDPSTLEYDASKSAIISVMHNLAREFSPYVNVNAIAPGWILTDKVVELDNSLNNKFITSEKDNILLKRFANEEDICNLLYFLACDEASYINDTVIRIDGGM